jgi:glycosyltransferase involved in cell wall biosynthesis
MRITIAMGFFLPVPALAGGATEKIWLRLAEAMTAEGHDVTVISRRWPGLASTERRNGVHHLRLPGWNHTRSLGLNLCLDWLWGRRVRRALPEGDVVVCNTVSLPFRLRRLRPAAGRVAVVLGRMPKGQVRIYGGVDLLLATSEAVATKARAENPAVTDRIVLFPNPIDWHRHRSASRQDKDRLPFRIGYIGRIHPEKGLEQLLEAAVLLTQRGDLPDWLLEFTGPWTVPQGGGGGAYRDGLREHYLPLLGDRFVLREPVFDPTALATIYGGLHAFCYPSLAARGEGLSIAPLEAMAAGAVPVVSRLACYRDVIRDGGNGFQFEHGSPEAAAELGRIFARLMVEPGLRSTLANRAQEDARRYDYAGTAAFLLREFARLTGTPVRTTVN